MLGRKSADYDQARAARLRTARRADALANAIKDVGVRLARGLDRARDRAAQLASTSSTARPLDLRSRVSPRPRTSRGRPVDRVVGWSDHAPVARSAAPRERRVRLRRDDHSALEATDYQKIRESIVAGRRRARRARAEPGHGAGESGDAPVQSRRPGGVSDGARWMPATDTARVLEAATGCLRRCGNDPVSFLNDD